MILAFNFFKNVLNELTTEVKFGNIALISSVAILLGIVIAATNLFCDKRCSKNFALTLAFLPIIVAIVILMVNGNVGIGVAVAGAFSLVRFRSIPGTGKDITYIFFAMAVGLCLGVGSVGYAVIICLFICLVSIVYHFIPVGRNPQGKKLLKILVPETMDFEHAFDEVFKKYCKKIDVKRIKTVSLGTMYELSYDVELFNADKTKEFLDAVRTLNGNLNVTLNSSDDKVDSL